MNLSDVESSYWISASAGSGKTTVLTKRLLSLLLAGASPERILCITFTRAGAGEIYNRINKTLAGWAVMPEAELLEEIAGLIGKTPGAEETVFARQLFTQIVDKPGSLKIQTIHAFCQSVLGRFPLEAGIAPGSRIIDEQTARELLDEAKKRLLLGNAEDPELKRGIENLAAHLHEEQFDELISEITNERIYLEKIIANKKAAIKNIEDFLGLKEGVDEKSLLENLINIPPEVITAIKNLPASNKTSFLHDFAALPLAARKSEPYIDFFLTQNKEPRKKLFPKEILKEDSAEYRLFLQEQARVFAAVEDLKSLKMLNQTRDFLNVAEALLSLYNHLKAVNSFIDYDDLIAKTLGLLSARELSAWVMYKLDGGIDHILVDEAQDTSPEQWQIIEYISLEFFSGHGLAKENKTLFFVGDEKQSIFSFQGANQKMFSLMHDRFALLAKNARKKWYSIQLSKSFRSSAPVLSAVDLVFAAAEYRAAISSSATPIKHDLHRVGQGGKVELWPLIKSPNSARPDYDLKNIQAKALAEEIAKWLADGRMLEGKGRPIKAGDIMVLVRKRDEFISYLVRALKNKNVPVAGIDRTILAEQIGIQDLVAMANFVLLPEDDLNLAGVLKSPLAQLSEEDLFELAYGRGDFSLWQKLEGEKFAKVYEYLQNIKTNYAGFRPFEFFSSLLQQNQGQEKMIARLGRQVEDHLNEFLNLTLQYERSHSVSLQGFLHWFLRGDIEIKRDFDMGRDEVKIMTVHAAKGLESGIVFLADTTTPPQSRGRLHKISSSLPLYVMKTDNHNMRTLGLLLDKKDAAYEEYLRLLMSP